MRNSFAVLLLAAPLVACTSDNTTDTNAAINEGTALGQDNAMLVDNTLTSQSDALSIIGVSGAILISIDEGEIVQAQQALALTSAPVAVGFAKRMIDAHTAHRATTLDLLASFHTGPLDNPVSRELQRETTQIMANVGASSDPAYQYMRTQVVQHNETLIIVQSMQPHAPDDNFAAFLTDTVTMLNNHRIDAENILEN